MISENLVIPKGNGSFSFRIASEIPGGPGAQSRNHRLRLGIRSLGGRWLRPRPATPTRRCCRSRGGAGAVGSLEGPGAGRGGV